MKMKHRRLIAAGAGIAASFALAPAKAITALL